MSRFQIHTASEQVTGYLRDELLRGAWSGYMPGVDRLSSELGVGIHTVCEALKQLETEGLIVGQGHRKRRRILTKPRLRSSALRLQILLYDHSVHNHHHDILNGLERAGSRASFAPKTLEDLGMDPKRVAEFVAKTAADGWLVEAGSRSILEELISQPRPVFAVFGRFRGLPMAGITPDKTEAVAEAARKLIQLGHSRIILIARSDRRLPEPGASERAFLGELQRHHLATGPYNLPDWEETATGLGDLLAQMFRFTPPTAIIVQTPDALLRVMQFLMERGLRVPGDVSLLCTERINLFNWCQPTIAHVDWDRAALIRRAASWARHVSQRKEDKKKSVIKARFVNGGTIGPAPSGECEPIIRQKAKKPMPSKALAFRGEPWGNR